MTGAQEEPSNRGPAGIALDGPGPGPLPKAELQPPPAR